MSLHTQSIVVWQERDCPPGLRPACSELLTEQRSSMYPRRDLDKSGIASKVVPILVWTSLSATAGCSGQSGFLTGGPTVGQLKTSLSHLEFENDQLRRQVAKLERENRATEDRLVQEQIDNGDLAARLDDARNLLRDRGLTADARIGSHAVDEGRRDRATPDDDENTANRAFPAGQSPRRQRKPPFARIPGPVDVLAPIEDDESSRGARGSRAGGDDRRRLRDDDDDTERHSYRASSARWLPVAIGTDDAMTRAR